MTLVQRSRSVPPAEKAAFHQETGAGKSKVKRQFFGLSAADEAAILERVHRGIEQMLRRGGV